jgi:hypothetical protein
VFIHVTDGASHVREATDLKSLSVRADPGVDLSTNLGTLGTPDPDGAHVWLLIDALREAAATTITDGADDWRAGFDGMIAYATKSGWTDERGTSVRAHIAS